MHTLRISGMFGHEHDLTMETGRKWFKCGETEGGWPEFYAAMATRDGAAVGVLQSAMQLCHHMNDGGWTAASALITEGEVTPRSYLSSMLWTCASLNKGLRTVRVNFVGITVTALCRIPLMTGVICTVDRKAIPFTPQALWNELAGGI